jgi:cold shock CspA family protein
MREPLQIIYRRIEPSNSVESCVREQLVELEACYEGIVSCDVIIEPRADGDSRDGGVHIHLGVGVPGLELDVDREAPGPQASGNIVAEVRSAFAEMQQRLTDYAQHAEVSGPGESLRGRGLVSALIAQENYGVISTAEGTEVYFHRDHVEDGAFGLLEVGSVVEFSAAPTLLGAQAVRVRLVG